MTGIVARMRRTIYANIGATAPTIVVPAKAGTHHSAAVAADKWIPACAGMTAVPSAPLSFLLDVPQEDHRGDDDAVEVLAVGGRHDELAGRHVGHLLVGLGLDLVGELLLHRRVGGLEPRIDQLFELGIGRPAEPRLG